MFSFLGCVRYNEDFVKSRLVSYIEVLFHTFYCNFGEAEGNHSLCLLSPKRYRDDSIITTYFNTIDSYSSPS